MILEAGRAERQYWRDLWRYRELFYILAWRDVSVRYKQTVIGVAWAVLQPLLTMMIMTVVFGKVARLPSEGAAPYALMVFAAMLPWQFFSTSLSAASQSLVGNAQLISKVYFPRMIIPAAAVITSFVDFLVSMLILVGMMAWYWYWPDWRILTLPLFMALAFVAAIGPGLWITALNVKYTVTSATSSRSSCNWPLRLPGRLQQCCCHPRAASATSPSIAVYSLNPMVGVDRRLPLGDPRWRRGSLLARLRPFNHVCLCCSSPSACGTSAKTERTFADVI